MLMDEAERRTLAEELRAAHRSSGLSQAEFAAHLGTSPSRLSTYLSGEVVPSAILYRRALAVAEAFAYSNRSGLMTPDRTARAVNDALAAGDGDFAFRMILQARDDLRTLRHGAPEQTARLAWLRRARRIQDVRFDTLFRSVIAHEFGDDAPEWAAGARLDVDWVVDDPFRSEKTIREQTPRWLATSRIFLAERALETA